MNNILHKDLTKKYQKEVGVNALKFLIETLPSENDEDCIELILESVLDAITDFDVAKNGDEVEEDKTANISQENTILLFNVYLYNIIMNRIEIYLIFY